MNVRILTAPHAESPRDIAEKLPSVPTKWAVSQEDVSDGEKIAEDHRSSAIAKSKTVGASSAAQRARPTRFL
jgi:hypothetical protein